MSPGDFILDDSLNNREMIGSVGLFKSTLVGHVAVHFRQYVKLYKEHESTGGQFIRSQGYMLKLTDMWEVEAYEAQKNTPLITSYLIHKEKVWIKSLIFTKQD